MTDQGRNSEVIKISYQIANNNFSISINDQYFYYVNYPKQIWQALKNKKVLVENFVYARLAPLGLATFKTIDFQIAKPYLRNFIDYGVAKDLPRISFVNKIKPKKLLSAFSKRKDFFLNEKNDDKIIPGKNISKGKAILALSFGKDSLLSYGLAKEIGLACQIVYVNEMEREYSAENKYKRKIIEEFSKEQKIKIEYLEDNADEIFYNPNLKIKIKELDNANGMLAFALELLPFAYDCGAKYLILGNEKKNDDFWKQDGFKAYPSFDQSSAYTKKENVYLNKLTKNNFQVISLIEPLYNLAEMKILYRRYPQLLKYLMSCTVEKETDGKWCCQCPICAKVFLYAVAVGGNPFKIGIKHNLFAEQYKKFYPLFAEKNNYYEMPKAVRDEQLLSFLLAYRLGYRGYLIDLFRKKYLGEAKRKEKGLRNKFFKVYPAKNLPSELKFKLIKIFQGELKGLI